MEERPPDRRMVQVGSLRLTVAEAARAGLLPEQQRERFKDSLAILNR